MQGAHVGRVSAGFRQFPLLPAACRKHRWNPHREGFSHFPLPFGPLPFGRVGNASTTTRHGWARATGGGANSAIVARSFVRLRHDAPLDLPARSRSGFASAKAGWRAPSEDLLDRFEET